MGKMSKTCSSLPKGKGFLPEKLFQYEISYMPGFLTLVNRIIWQKPHNCGFFYVKFIKF